MMTIKFHNLARNLLKFNILFSKYIKFLSFIMIINSFIGTTNGMLLSENYFNSQFFNILKIMIQINALLVVALYISTLWFKYIKATMAPIYLLSTKYVYTFLIVSLLFASYNLTNYKLLFILATTCLPSSLSIYVNKIKFIVNSRGIQMITIKNTEN